MKHKILIFLFSLLISGVIKSQNTIKATDTLIDFSHKSNAVYFNQLLATKFNNQFYSSSLVILNGIMLSMRDTDFFSKLQPYIKRLEIFTERDTIKKYSSDPSIERVFLITLKDSARLGNTQLGLYQNKNSANINNIVGVAYTLTTNKADGIFNDGHYREALNLYLFAFKNNQDLGKVKHRYNVASCYIKLGQLDSAFIQLFRIAEKGSYYNFSEIQNDPVFQPLYVDERWPRLLKIIRQNAIRFKSD